MGGGPDFDWSKTSYQYHEDMGKSWLQTLKDEADSSQNEHTVIPDVDLSSVNDDQSFAFNIVIQTLIKSRKEKSSETDSIKFKISFKTPRSSALVPQTLSCLVCVEDS